MARRFSGLRPAVQRGAVAMLAQVNRLIRWARAFDSGSRHGSRGNHCPRRPSNWYAESDWDLHQLRQKSASDLAGRLEADLSQAGFFMERRPRDQSRARMARPDHRRSSRRERRRRGYVAPLRSHKRDGGQPGSDRQHLSRHQLCTLRSSAPRSCAGHGPGLRASFGHLSPGLCGSAPLGGVGRSLSSGADQLIDSIRAVLRGEKRYRSWFNDLTPFNFSAFLNEKRRNLTGRKWSFDQIDGWRRASNCDGHC